MSEPAATPKVVAYAALTGIGLLAAVVSRRRRHRRAGGPFAFALASAC